MKVVFPCSGALVLLKEDLETLKAFYNTNLLTSKMANVYQNTNTTIQVNNFNYFPISNSLVLYNAHVLTIEQMRKILGISNVTPSQPSVQPENTIPEEQDYISDDDLLSNPFFTTLAPLN